MNKEETKKSIDDFIKEWEDYKNESEDGKLRFFKSYWFITDYSKPAPNIESLGSTGESDPTIDYFTWAMKKQSKIPFKQFKNELRSSGLRERWSNSWKIFLGKLWCGNSRKKLN